MTKSTTYGTSLLLICFFKKTPMSMSFSYKIGFMVPHNLSTHARKLLQPQLDTIHKKLTQKWSLMQLFFSSMLFVRIFKNYVYETHLPSCSFFQTLKSGMKNVQHRMIVLSSFYLNFFSLIIFQKLAQNGSPKLTGFNKRLNFLSHYATFN